MSGNQKQDGQSNSKIRAWLDDEIKKMAALSELAKLEFPSDLVFSDAPYDIIHLRAFGRLFGLTRYRSYRLAMAHSEAISLATFFKNQAIETRVFAWDEKPSQNLKMLFEDLECDDSE